MPSARRAVRIPERGRTPFGHRVFNTAISGLADGEEGSGSISVLIVALGSGLISVLILAFAASLEEPPHGECRPLLDQSHDLGNDGLVCKRW
jgi:hypothetical protein